MGNSRSNCCSSIADKSWPRALPRFPRLAREIGGRLLTTRKWLPKRHSREWPLDFAYLSVFFDQLLVFAKLLTGRDTL